MLKIMILDDSAFMRSYLRSHLEEAGFVVEDFCPGSAMEVFERVRAFKPDLVLSDHNMPHVDGIHVARSCRRGHPDAIVLVLTSTRDPSLEHNLKREDVRRILHKPMRGEEVLQVVTEVLGG